MLTFPSPCIIKCCRRYGADDPGLGNLVTLQLTLKRLFAALFDSFGAQRRRLSYRVGRPVFRRNRNTRTRQAAKFDESGALFVGIPYLDTALPLDLDVENRVGKDSATIDPERDHLNYLELHLVVSQEINFFRSEVTDISAVLNQRLYILEAPY